MTPALAWLRKYRPDETRRKSILDMQAQWKQRPGLAKGERQLCAWPPQVFWPIQNIRVVRITVPAGNNQRGSYDSRGFVEWTEWRPRNIETEKTLLGSILVRNEIF